MKQKSFMSVIIVIALLAITTGSALADGVVTGMTITRSGALTLTFTVTGQLSSEQLNSGYVQVQGGDDYKLHCSQKDATTVICHAPAKIVDGVVVGFGGSTFWVEKPDMPKPHTKQTNQAEYCYPIFGSNSDTNPTDFAYLGTHCDPTGELHPIEFYDPYSGNDTAYFVPTGAWVDDPAMPHPCLDSYTDHGAGYYGWCYSVK